MNNCNDCQGRCCNHPRLMITQYEHEQLPLFKVKAVEYSNVGSWDSFYEKKCLVTYNDKRYEIIVDHEDPCPYLEKGIGCKLTKEQKPIICRVFPFWLDSNVNEIVFDKDQDLVCGLIDKSIDEVLNIIGEDKQTIRDLVCRWYDCASIDYGWKMNMVIEQVVRKRVSGTFNLGDS